MRTLIYYIIQSNTNNLYIILFEMVACIIIYIIIHELKNLAFKKELVNVAMYKIDNFVITITTVSTYVIFMVSILTTYISWVIMTPHQLDLNPVLNLMSKIIKNNILYFQCICVIIIGISIIGYLIIILIFKFWVKHLIKLNLYLMYSKKYNFLVNESEEETFYAKILSNLPRVDILSWILERPLVLLYKKSEKRYLKINNLCEWLLTRERVFLIFRISFAMLLIGVYLYDFVNNNKIIIHPFSILPVLIPIIWLNRAARYIKNFELTSGFAKVLHATYYHYNPFYKFMRNGVYCISGEFYEFFILWLYNKLNLQINTFIEAIKIINCQPLVQEKFLFHFTAAKHINGKDYGVYIFSIDPGSENITASVNNIFLVRDINLKEGDIFFQSCLDEDNNIIISYDKKWYRIFELRG